eukprot:c52527_g1_i1.p1 GENE.c52527_g1_i1~~c52527_g1_i1.p1  ORF type:complete len:504 (-),score=114.20 c52527_g1_i1:31-1521(-)
MSAPARIALIICYVILVGLHGATIYFAGDYESIRIHKCGTNPGGAECSKLIADNNHVTDSLVHQGLFNSMIGLSASFALLLYIIRFTYGTKLQATGFVLVSFTLNLATLFFAARQMTIKFEDGSEHLDTQGQGYLLGALVAAQTAIAFVILIFVAHFHKFVAPEQGAKGAAQIVVLVVAFLAIAAALLRVVEAAVLFNKVWLMQGGGDVVDINLASFFLVTNALFEGPINVGVAILAFMYAVKPNEISRTLSIAASWLGAFLSLNTLYDGIKQLSIAMVDRDANVLAVASLAQPVLSFLLLFAVLAPTHDAGSKPESSPCSKIIHLVLFGANLAAFGIRVGLSVYLKDIFVNCTQGNVDACVEFADEANSGSIDLINTGLLSSLLGIGSCFLVFFHLIRWRTFTRNLALSSTMLSVVVGVYALAYASQVLDLSYDSSIGSQLENLGSQASSLQSQDRAFVLAIFTLAQPVVQLVLWSTLICFRPTTGGETDALVQA